MLETFSLSFGAPDLGQVTSAIRLCELGPKSLNAGVYRVLSLEQAKDLRAYVALAFPLLTDEAVLFAVDWTGRVFFEKDATIHICEPESGECFNTDVNFKDFHNIELVQYADATLRVELFKQWRHAGGRAPSQTECVGFARPLFLGGSESVENLEITDLAVYWGVLAQLITKTRELPLGTKVGKLTLQG